MKYSLAAILIAAAALADGPVTAATISCSDINMSQLTALIGGMADGPPKWEMYGYLATINAATARDGARGCDTALMDMTAGKHR